MMYLSLVLSLSLIHLPLRTEAQARNRVSFSSIPEDLYAFPKYRVSFLNKFPVANQTAHIWLQGGLRGGEEEFLGKEWNLYDAANTDDRRGIAGPEDLDSPPRYYRRDVELLRIGPQNPYVCYIPPPPSSPPPQRPDYDESSAAVFPPSRSWELLQPLVGSCLYHRQGWFTYSYCHGQHVKQFRELPHAHPHPPGGRIPEEDPNWESYTLGVAPYNPNEAELVSLEDLATANKLELARGAGQRYLIQRWEDGTVCDKTDQSRKIEVQFHCSMTTTDTILFVKEVATCQYIIVIYTPRLCGEPGFKSERDTQEETLLRCREILPDNMPLPKIRGGEDEEGDAYPIKRGPKSVGVIQKPKEKEKEVVKDEPAVKEDNKDPTSVIKSALKALLARAGTSGPVEAHVAVEDTGETYVINVDANENDDEILEEKVKKVVAEKEEERKKKDEETKHRKVEL